MIDLHIHLDGSLSPDCVYNLAKAQNIKLPCDRATLPAMLTVPTNCSSLNDYLRCFDLPLLVLQTPQAVKTAVISLCYTLMQQGLTYAEIRFAPQKHLANGFTQNDIVKGAIDGLDTFNCAQNARLNKNETNFNHLNNEANFNPSNIDVNMANSTANCARKKPFTAKLILCCMRGNDNEKENLQTLFTAKDFLNYGVVGLDLAGAEALFKTKNFATIFEMARQNKVPFTIHAGEADGAESILYAINFGACRIGHGVRCIEDKNVLNTIIARRIPLELCLTSNLQTKAVGSVAQFPIKQLLKLGVVATLNTDNLTVSNTTLAGEFALAKSAFNLTENEVNTLHNNAKESV
ncbi:MAG: adenosine deaminase family protein, partial [Clostridia bacterium]